MPEPNKHEQWIADYLAGELAEDDYQALEYWLLEDEANAKQLARAVLLDSQMRSAVVTRRLQSGLSMLKSQGNADDEQLQSIDQEIMTELVEQALAERRRHEIEDAADMVLIPGPARRKPAPKLHLTDLARDLFPRPVIWLAAAVLVVAATVLIVFLSGPKDQPAGTTPGDLAIDPPAEQVTPIILATTIDVDLPLWANGQHPGPDGYVAGRYLLSEGAVRIELADGTRVKLTAPVDFEITGRNEIGVSSGELVADVPPQAIGFRVRTPAGDVVDLGTTFGVEVRDDQTTDVQVVDGLVRVAARDESGELGDFVELTTMQAARLDKEEQRVASIPTDGDRFTMEYVRTLDLVDIVAGGDGTGGARMRALHPVTGEAMDKPFTGLDEDLHVQSVSRYQPVLHNRFIDGVFVPDRADGVQVDSAGHTVDGLAITRPTSYQVIWAGGVLPGVESPEMSEHLARIYPDQDLDRVAVLCMIPNKGITFDLGAARSALRTQGVVHYKMVVQNLSLRHNATEVKFPKADIICYLDGKAVSRTIDLMPEDGGIEIAFDVPADTRFLSIVVTDSGDRIGRDWVVFHRPQIVFKQAGPWGTPEPR